jgi:sulfofructose kinase
MKGSPDRIDALGLGVAVRDIAIHLDTFPQADHKYQAKNLYEAGGGPVATALVTLSRFGRRAAFAGVVAANAVGKFVVESLEEENVDTSGVVYRQGFASPTSVILVENGRRTIFECWQYDLPVSIEELEERQVPFDACRALLVDVRAPEAQIEAARRVRNAGGIVVLDCGHPRRGVDEILPLTDIAILSYTYPRSLYGEDYDPVEFLKELRTRLPADGLRIAGLTLGAEGSALLTTDSSFIRIPGHRIKAVDSTGAGDVFHGAFVHAFLNGETPESAARFANAAAALKCTGMTGRSPLPPENEIWNLARDRA